MYRFMFAVLILASFTYNVGALNILAIVSLPLRSHYMAFGNLFRELAKRGHHVTVLNNFPDEHPTPNLTFVTLSTKARSAYYMPPLYAYEKSGSWYWHIYNMYRHLEVCPVIIKHDCETFFTNEDVKAHYDKETKYDVIFVEQFVSDCGLAYAAAFYDAPIIGITSHTLFPWSYPRLGIPFDVWTDSLYFSPGGPNPPFYMKIENFFMNSFFKTFGLMYHHKVVYEVFDRYLPNHSLDVERAARDRMKMMFVYQHFSLTGARLLSPQLLEIAGLHITPPKPVSPDMEKFLSTATDGAVYVSFGSNLKANTMTSQMREEFLKAFSSLSQKVIWKYENASFTQNGLMTGDWFPQMDILCHSKTIAFVSHGGMLGLSEAAYCGKPVLVLPFFGDQYSNAAAAQHIGMGNVIMFDKVNAESLADAIKSVITTKMQENAKRISKFWHDRPMSVVDSAIYWTEYVGRHGTGPPQLPTQSSSYFPVLLLDVAILVFSIAAVLGGILYVTLKLVKLLFKLFYRRKLKAE